MIHMQGGWCTCLSDIHSSKCLSIYRARQYFVVTGISRREQNTDKYLSKVGLACESENAKTLEIGAEGETLTPGVG